jgi:hypothetical protein
MSPTTFIQTPHGLACDGCGVAKDDLCAIETMEKQERGIHELFHNAARIHTAMRGNRWLIPIFRKYRKTCREILQQKKKEADQLAMLSEYCDDCAHDPHQPNHDLKCIQSEMREIHNQIKSLEEMKWTDDDSDSSSCSSCSSDCSDSEDEHGETQGETRGETREECNGSSESEDSDDSEDSSSDSEDSDDSGLSDVMEFLRQSLIE